MVKTIGVLTAAVLAGAGVYGMISRRNLAFIVLSIELIFNSGIMLFVLSIPKFSNVVDAASLVVLLLAVGAAEVAVGFAVAVYAARHHRVSDVLKIAELGGQIESD